MSEGKLDQVVYSSIVTWYGFYQKVSNDIRKELHKWIFNHPHVISGPDKRDTLLVPNPDNIPGPKIRMGKWLIQIPITELHQDLLSTGDLGFKDCRNANGDVIIPDTALRELMLKIIRPMSDRYKEMCCCTICMTMQMHQNNLNRFRNTFLTFLNKKINTIPSEREEEKEAAETRYRNYKSVVLPVGVPLHPKENMQ